jgi:hypothetical protein
MLSEAIGLKERFMSYPVRAREGDEWHSCGPPVCILFEQSVN